MRLVVDQDAELELANIQEGVFAPLSGFFGGKDYRSVVDEMHIQNGSPWTIPVTLDLDEGEVKRATSSGVLTLIRHDGTELGKLEVEDIFRVDLEHDLQKVFGTTDRRHPGVDKEGSRSPYRVGGKVRPTRLVTNHSAPASFSPVETRKIFRERGWKSVAGFQTRNPIHKAHEYLQRLALEMTDGLFLQPLIGWKKSGDIAPEAVVASYRRMVKDFYPLDRVLFGTLRTPMRYAGPREAVFHAIVRRNYGCTHFIVGRDHAGVGNYYGKYEAQDFCKKFPDLGIKILDFAGPYFCGACGHIVTERSCPHGEKYVVHVSGTEVRDRLRRGEKPPVEYMRPEIAEVLLEMQKEGKLFIED
ncbi:MAG: sulfate adenylyltransferase [Deltaproteobacteria bacterium]|nr:sulfate adenylyltransferase [Deltaproteobacteria bacterium]MBI2500071.1 sulfate adenylyltransferase [Deltaproteobacteria bacterium]